MGLGGGARALCRRAGGAGGGGQPLYRRGRRRTGRDRLRAARSGDRSARRLRKFGAAAASAGQDQRNLGARLLLRRHQGGVRARRSPRRHEGRVSAPVVHADRMLRRRRPAQSGQGQLRRAGEFPGAVLDASGDGARAARGRAEIAPAHSAGFRRQFRHKAFGVSLCRADGARRAHHRPPGQMGRGPHRASGRRKLRPEPRHRDRGGGHQRRPHPRAQTRSARGLRRVFARADAGAALPHARRGHRRLRHRKCRGEKPRRAHQQNAGEPHPRLRRPAALSGAGAADAAHRGRAETRSARRDPAQSHSGAEISPIAPRPARSTIPAIMRAPSTSPSATAGSPNSSAGATRRAPPAANTASALPSWSSRRCRTWAISRP